MPMRFAITAGGMRAVTRSTKRACSALVGTQAFGFAIVSAAQICEPVFISLLDRSEASRKARMAAITPLETRIAAGPVALPARSARAMPLNTKHRLIPSLGINTYISMLMGAVLNGRNHPASPPFSGRLSRNFCMRPRGMFGATLPD